MREESHRSSAAAGEGLLSPLALLSVLVLVLNDHWLKQAYPCWVSGKLSDFAGLLFFPLLLQAAWEKLIHLRGRFVGPSQSVLWVSSITTALVFTWVQLGGTGEALYRWGLGGLQWPARLLLAGEWINVIPVSVTPDLTDLIALPAIGLALWVGGRRRDGCSNTQDEGLSSSSHAKLPSL